MINIYSFSIYLLFVCTLLGYTNDNAIPPDDPEGPGSYQTMDYGPVISESIRMNWPENSLVRKGLAIRLDHEAAMIFDTDLMRFAAGVEGGWVDMSETDYTSYKGSGIAKIEGRQVFGSPAIAGWANEGRFDPQREDGMGNLPNDWAHYNGYYRYGDQVVLSYSVGETEVLELPEAISHEGSLAYARSMQVEQSDETLQALILKKHDSWAVSRATDRGIILDTGEAALAVKLVQAPDDVRLSEGKGVDAGLIKLHVPPSREAQTIRVLIFEMSRPDDTLFQKLPDAVAHSEMPDFKTMTRGGSSQWNKTIETSGTLSDENSGYVIDRLGIPFENPWGAWMRLSGIDFFDDGRRAAVSTWNGDVWIVSGIDKSLENLRWRRFASGMFYPMGVAVVDGDIYVTERSQLTRLHDRNGDGEADYYENFNNDGIVYPRALTVGLEVDSEGYFYFFKNGNRVPSEIPQHGALIRVSPDGSKREVYGRGFRSANTLGIGPGDKILTGDQQGRWVPVDRISVVKEKGGFYGFRPHGGENLQVGEFKVPTAWMPHTVESSAGFLTFAGDSRWGPMAGQWILGSYTQRTLFAVLTEEVGGRYQGGIVKLPGVKSQSGVMRAHVNPGDGQLYMAGLQGWGTTATTDGSFERLRYAGGDVNLPDELHITPEGVKIRFTNPVKPTSARNAKNYEVKRWDYLYTDNYGSPAMSLENPLQKGQDIVNVSSATVSEDGQTVFLEIPDMRSVMQMEITYNLAFQNGQKAANRVYHTVNWLSEADADNEPEWQQRIISGLRDPFIETEEYIPAKRLISENECRTCHRLEEAAIGPSFMKIAQRYEKNEETIDQLATKVIKGGSGNWGQLAMPPHPDITKAKASNIVSYILSVSEEQN